jgi:hypothetical protein
MADLGKAEPFEVRRSGFFPLGREDFLPRLRVLVLSKFSGFRERKSSKNIAKSI